MELSPSNKKMETVIEPGKRQATNKKYFTARQYAGASMLSIVAIFLLYFISRYNYNLFHGIADGISILTAACAFTIIWNSRRLVDNNYFLFVGTGFLFFAFLDSLHLLGNKHMDIFIGYGNLGPTFYIAGRYVLGITLIMAPLFIRRNLNTALTFSLYFLATLLFLLSVFYWNIFPACIIEGKGLTTFKLISDYIVCLILLGAIGLLIINRQFFDPRVLRLIISSIILFIATGLFFTLYTNPFEITNLLGHLVQIASFYLVYLAFIETSVTKPQEILYRKLKQEEETLARNLRHSDDANVILQQEVAERKRAEEALNKSVERLAIISETANQLLMSRSPQLIVDKLCHKVMEHLDCNVFFNFLVDDERKCLRLNAYGGIPDEAAHRLRFLDFGSAVCGCVAKEARRIVAENIPTTYDIRTDLVRSFGITAYASYPLFAQGQVIGTLSFGTRSHLTFAEDELSLMKTVSDQVAIAMERIRLLQSAEARAEELEDRVRERTSQLSDAYEKLIKETEEREQLEEKLRQAHKMEAIGTLAGGIAHDFNNILSAIVGFTEIAAEDAESRPDIQKSLDKVLKSSVRARELIKQILTFSRKTSLERSPLSVSPIVKETMQLLRASIPAMIDIKVSITVASDVILAAPIEIQQVIMNLVTNASLAMQEKGGVIEVILSNAHAGPELPASGEDTIPEHYIELIVKDTGIGMDPGLIERIFEPFFTTREVGKGTGMGLAVVYGIVKDLNGTISVESAPGQGSTFKILLPKIEPDLTGTSITPAEIQGGSERILFVDDEDAIVEWGRSALERLGYKVTVASDGREALTLFSADPSLFDLIITDHAMPQIAGLQLCSSLFAVRRDIPIILCTGFNNDMSSKMLKDAGIKEVLVKPLGKQILAATVRRVLDSLRSQTTLS